LAIIAAGAAASTLNPRWSGYFASPFFLAPCLAFAVNLGACAAARLRRELRRKSRRHGPDILHAGLLVALIGAMASAAGRTEGVVPLRIGDSVRLPAGGVLTLTDFIAERYEDGRPRSWTSVVSVDSGKGERRDGLEIRVNAPLRIGGLGVYQSSVGSESELRLSDRSGNSLRLSIGEETDGAEPSVRFSGVDASGNAEAVVREAGRERRVRVGKTATAVGPYDAVVVERTTSVLRAVSDPGFPIAAAGLILAAIGAAATLFRKLKEELR